MIVIGASLGGLDALLTLLPGLPATFPEPLVIVLHRHREAGDMLAQTLQRGSALIVSEALDKEPIQSGHIYVAPPDYHLLVERTHLSLSTDEPVNYARPSIDVLFESAAEAFGPEIIGIVLTGTSLDGARGAAMIKQRGGLVIVQDPADAHSAAMPAAVLSRTQPDYVRPLDGIAPLLLELVTKTL